MFGIRCLKFKFPQQEDQDNLHLGQGHLHPYAVPRPFLKAPESVLRLIRARHEATDFVIQGILPKIFTPPDPIVIDPEGVVCEGKNPVLIRDCLDGG